MINTLIVDTTWTSPPSGPCANFVHKMSQMISENLPEIVLNNHLPRNSFDITQSLVFQWKLQKGDRVFVCLSPKCHMWAFNNNNTSFSGFLVSQHLQKDESTNLRSLMHLLNYNYSLNLDLNLWSDANCI